MGWNWVLRICVLFCVTPVAAQAETITIRASQHPLNPEDHTQTHFGKLIFVSGVVLKSDSSDFGGFSGLALSADGRRMLAITDAGKWLRAALRYTDGRLSGIADAEMFALMDEDGRALGDKQAADSESLTLEQPGNLDGPVLVSFERNHRVLRYPLNLGGFGAKPLRISMPPALANAPGNKGIEALEQRADGAIIAFAEDWPDSAGNHTGWLTGKDGAQNISLRRDGLFQPTDLEFLPGGDLLVLERRFTMMGGPGMQIRRIKADSIKPGALLDGEVLISLTAKYGIDNMEGLAARTNAAGGTELFVISDDNFKGFQKTVLLQFLLPAD